MLEESSEVGRALGGIGFLHEAQEASGISRAELVFLFMAVATIMLASNRFGYWHGKVMGRLK